MYGFLEVGDRESCDVSGVGDMLSSSFGYQNSSQSLSLFLSLSFSLPVSFSLCSPLQSILLSLVECRMLPVHLLSCSHRLTPLAVVPASDVLGGVEV